MAEAKELRKNIERLTGLIGADPGIVSLACHAFLERYIIDVYYPHTSREELRSIKFRTMLDCILTDLKGKLEGPRAYYERITLDQLGGRIRNGRRISDRVRHYFSSCTVEEAKNEYGAVRQLLWRHIEQVDLKKMMDEGFRKFNNSYSDEPDAELDFLLLRIGELSKTLHSNPREVRQKLAQFMSAAEGEDGDE